MAVQKSRGTQRSINPIETATNSDSGFFRSEASKTADTVKDQFAGVGQDFISQLLGWGASESDSMPRKAKQGEMKRGEMIDLRRSKIGVRQTHVANSERPKMRTERRSEILGGIDYRNEILHGSERLSRREADELQERIQEIMQELVKLIKSSAILQAEFIDVSIQQAPVNAGKYHLNFFEWLLAVIRNVRMKVEDSGAWLNVVKSKKSQRKYGAMAKKHGTSFTLSNERTTATQTG